MELVLRPFLSARQCIACMHDPPILPATVHCNVFFLQADRQIHTFLDTSGGLGKVPFNNKQVQFVLFSKVRSLG